MDRENYEVDIKTWASSLMELDEYSNDSNRIFAKRNDDSSLVALSSTYYRSKAFSSAIGLNNLVNAADPILTLVTKLRRINLPGDASHLHNNICHEIKAFENKAQTYGYRPQLILAARFVLCALLDEMIAITLWPDLDWKKYSLVESFHKDHWESDRFYLILDRSLQDPDGHLDLLELIYLALRLGYEGKYRNIERGLLELRMITDNLFNTILQYKEEFSRNLHICPISLNYLQNRKKNYLHLMPPSWLISLIMVTCLVIMFSCCYFWLHQAASPIIKFLESTPTKSTPLTTAIGP